MAYSSCNISSELSDIIPEFGDIGNYTSHCYIGENKSYFRDRDNVWVEENFGEERDLFWLQYPGTNYSEFSATSKHKQKGCENYTIKEIQLAYANCEESLRACLQIASCLRDNKKINDLAYSLDLPENEICNLLHNSLQDQNLIGAKLWIEKLIPSKKDFPCGFSFFEMAFRPNALLSQELHNQFVDSIISLLPNSTISTLYSLGNLMYLHQNSSLPPLIGVYNNFISDIDGIYTSLSEKYSESLNITSIPFKNILESCTNKKLLVYITDKISENELSSKFSEARKKFPYKREYALVTCQNDEQRWPTIIHEMTHAYIRYNDTIIENNHALEVVKNIQKKFLKIDSCSSEITDSTECITTTKTKNDLFLWLGRWYTLNEANDCFEKEYSQSKAEEIYIRLLKVHPNITKEKIANRLDKIGWGNDEAFIAHRLLNVFFYNDTKKFNEELYVTAIEIKVYIKNHTLWNTLFSPLFPFISSHEISGKKEEL